MTDSAVTIDEAAELICALAGREGDEDLLRAVGLVVLAVRTRTLSEISTGLHALILEQLAATDAQIRSRDAARAARSGGDDGRE